MAHVGDKGSRQVLLYSDDRSTRQAVIDGIGARLTAGGPTIDWVEAATAAGAVEKFAAGGFSALVLDGETKKIGGMALLRQLSAEFDEVPPALILIARQQDEWLARYAGSQAVLLTPLDPTALRRALASVLS